jgi:DNA-directed RNA polymerase specialized sigma24 family protein
MHNAELKVLIQGVQQGDPEAFRCLFEQIRPSLAAYIRRHHPHAEDQQDILQKTFFNIYRAISGGRYHHINEVAFLQWIKKIAWHEIIYHRATNWGPVTFYSYLDKDGKEISPDLRDPKARADQRLEDLNLSQFLDQQLDEVLIQREETAIKKDLGVLKKMAFLRFYVDQVSQRELVGLISHYAVNLGLQVKISQTVINNWVSRGDILKTLVKHLVEKHREVLEVIDWEFLCPNLDAQEKAVLQQAWGSSGNEPRPVNRDQIDPLPQEAYKTAKQKVTHALFLRIKEQLHLLRHPRPD